MKLLVARAMMALAARCCGDHRREWALAMQTEFEFAAEAGDGLSFAFGCLLGALCGLPMHEEGRFAMASHVLAVGVIIPMGTLLLWSVASGFSYLSPQEASAASALGSGQPAFVNEANLMGLPLMAVLSVVLGIGHLCMAWAMLDRNWDGVAFIGRIGAALMVTIVILTAALFLYDSCALPEAVAIAIELAVIRALVWWHSDIRRIARNC